MCFVVSLSQREKVESELVKRDGFPVDLCDELAREDLLEAVVEERVVARDEKVEEDLFVEAARSG